MKKNLFLLIICLFTSVLFTRDVDAGYGTGCKTAGGTYCNVSNGSDCLNPCENLGYCYSSPYLCDMGPTNHQCIYNVRYTPSDKPTCSTSACTGGAGTYWFTNTGNIDCAANGCLYNNPTYACTGSGWACQWQGTNCDSSNACVGSPSKKYRDYYCSSSSCNNYTDSCVSGKCGATCTTGVACGSGGTCNDSCVCVVPDECSSGACCDTSSHPYKIKASGTVCGYSSWNTCNSTCIKKRDIYKCDGSSATCPATDQGDDTANIPSGSICDTSFASAERPVSSYSYCNYELVCASGTCTKIGWYTSCNGAGACRPATDHTNAYSEAVGYASASKVLTATCGDQDAGSSASCASVVNSCTPGSCSGTLKYPECNGSGTCDSSATTYYYSQARTAATGYTLTTDCVNGSTACGYSTYNGRSADKCDKKRDKLACDASQNCTYDAGDDFAYVSANKIANSSGQEVNASAADYAGVTCHSCTDGACSGTARWGECNGSGNAATAANCSTYSESATIYASAGYTLTLSCDTTGTTNCDSSICNASDQICNRRCDATYHTCSDYNCVSHCYDSVQDCDETGLDCGGSCTSCTVPVVCTRGYPSVSITPNPQSGTAGQALSYTVTVINNDNSVCGNSTFSLSAITCPSGWTCALAQTSLTIAYGSSGSTNLSVTSASGATAGNNTITVRAINSGATSYYGDGSATYTVIVPTLSVVLTAAPSSGSPTLSVALSADVGGTAAGTVNFKFHCNSATTPGTWEHSFDTIDVTVTDASPVNRTDSQGHTHSTQRLAGEIFKVYDLCSYTANGNYTPRVKVERSTATPPEATASVTVSSTPTGSLSCGATTQSSITVNYSFSNSASSQVTLFRGATAVANYTGASGSGNTTDSGLSAGTAYTYYLRDGTLTSSPQLAITVPSCSTQSAVSCAAGGACTTAGDKCCSGGKLYTCQASLCAGVPNYQTYSSDMAGCYNAAGAGVIKANAATLCLAGTHVCSVNEYLAKGGQATPPTVGKLYWLFDYNNGGTWCGTYGIIFPGGSGCIAAGANSTGYSSVCNNPLLGYMGDWPCSSATPGTMCCGTPSNIWVQSQDCGASSQVCCLGSIAQDCSGSTCQCCATPDFSISASSLNISVPQETGYNQSNITVTSLYSFSSAVTLSTKWCSSAADTTCSQSAPAGVYPNYSSNPVTPLSGSSVTPNLTITTSGATAGTYYLRVRGVSGALIHDTNVITITVNAPSSCVAGGACLTSGNTCCAGGKIYKCQNAPINITPSEDTWAREFYPDWTGGGTQANLFIGFEGNCTTCGQNFPYLKFDLSTIPAGSSITSANLSLYTYDSVSIPTNVRKVANDTWTESVVGALTWNNRSSYPMSDILTSGTINNGWNIFNVTSYVQTEFAGDKKASFGLEHTGTCSAHCGTDYLTSKENGTTNVRPYLQITVNSNQWVQIQDCSASSQVCFSGSEVADPCSEGLGCNCCSVACTAIKKTAGFNLDVHCTLSANDNYIKGGNLNMVTGGQIQMLANSCLSFASGQSITLSGDAQIIKSEVNTRILKRDASVVGVSACP